MKHEWRKHEKNIYLPKNTPEVVDVPDFDYFMIKGKGNPNEDFFGEYIKVLYALSYGVRMSYKGDDAPYTVYPLEGVWDISDEAKRKGIKVLDKSTLVFNLMIRQPEFVTYEYAQKIIDITKKNKPNELLDKAKFGTIKEGKCVQMLHKGSYDDEPASFALMEAYCEENGLIRASKTHREIYLSDARKTESEKLKTVLRFTVK